jgi:hypothetical protein
LSREKLPSLKNFLFFLEIRGHNPGLQLENYHTRASAARIYQGVAPRVLQQPLVS